MSAHPSILTSLVPLFTSPTPSPPPVYTDAATIRSVSSMSGIDHFCIPISHFNVDMQPDYVLAGENAYSNYQDDVDTHYSVVIELNPEANPC